MEKHDKLQQQWHGTDAGDTLHEIAACMRRWPNESAREQEASRERIRELVQALRQGGMYGKYDPHNGFVEEPPSKQARRKR